MTTVTVLYFGNNDIMTMRKAVLSELKVSPLGRVILPDAFRSGKTVVAIIEGDVNVLNMTGEREALPSEVALNTEGDSWQ